MFSFLPFLLLRAFLDISQVEDITVVHGQRFVPFRELSNDTMFNRKVSFYLRKTRSKEAINCSKYCFLEAKTQLLFDV